jgi:tetratricopeptide (TPR) repeat protein
MLRGLLLALVFLVGARAVEAGAQAEPTDDPSWLESARIPGVSFEELQRRAAEAASAGQPGEALRYFRAAVELNPLWHQGWFYIGSIHYGQGHYEAARDAFRRVVKAAPQVGEAWALLGFCDFRLAGYDQAFATLSQALALGFEDNEDIEGGTRYHLALLRMRLGDFEGAVEHLLWLVRNQPPNPPLLDACGLMILRRPHLPSEIPPEEKELVTAAGWAAYSTLAGRYDEARPLYEDLVARYPKARGVHCAYGLFLVGRGSEEALDLLAREVELFPDNARAQIELAFQHLQLGDPSDALPYARAAVHLSPDVYTSHFALGRALLSTGSVEESIPELEEALRLNPEISEIYVSLGQAYARVGRTADMEAVRESLRELDARRQSSQ